MAACLLVLLCACTLRVQDAHGKGTVLSEMRVNPPDSSDRSPLARLAEFTTAEEEVPEPEPPVERITLSFLGDLMLASEYDNTAWSSFNRFAQNRDPSYFLAALYPILSQDDLTVGNLENVLTDGDLAPSQKNYSPAYWYRAPSSFAEILRAGSVEAVSLANNHTMDFGRQGLMDTRAALERADVMWGDSAHVLTVEKYGVRISILCTTITYAGNCAGGEAWINTAVETSDYQILYFHGGVNFAREPDESILRTCRAYADRGVDLIVGHHPHLLQPAEQYGDVLIVPSLGTCLFGHGKIENAGAILQLTLTVREGEITNADTMFTPIYVYGNPFQPEPMYEDDAGYVLDFLYGNRALPRK